MPDRLRHGRLFFIASLVATFASGHANGRVACFDLVAPVGEISIRQLTEAEIEAEAINRVRQLESRRIETALTTGDLLHDQTTAEFNRLAHRAQELSRLALSGPDSATFREALREMRESNASLVDAIRRLSEYLKPTGLFGRAIAKVRSRSQDRVDSLEEAILKCRESSATCAVDLQNGLSAYRQIYAQLGRFHREVSNQVEIWRRVSELISNDALTRSDIGSRLLAISNLRMMIEGLASRMDTEFALAQTEIRSLQMDIPNLLTAAVVNGADAGILREVKTRYEQQEMWRIQRAEAERLREEERRAAQERELAEKEAEAKAKAVAEQAYQVALAQREIERSTERNERRKTLQERNRRREESFLSRPKNNEARLQDYRVRRDRIARKIDEIIANTKTDQTVRLNEFHALLDQRQTRLTADQALDLLNSLDNGIDWVFGEHDPYPYLSEQVKQIEGAYLRRQHTIRYHVDLEVAALILAKTEPEWDLQIRYALTSRIRSLIDGSDDFTDANRGRDRYQEETIRATLDALILRWEEKSRKI